MLLPQKPGDTYILGSFLIHTHESHRPCACMCLYERVPSVFGLPKPEGSISIFFSLGVRLRVRCLSQNTTGLSLYVYCQQWDLAKSEHWPLVRRRVGP